jgi:hypothetical protein
MSGGRDGKRGRARFLHTYVRIKRLVQFVIIFEQVRVRQHRTISTGRAPTEGR